ncbi:MAG: hypothetical protein MUD03_06420, partial [Pirellula sp.]|nr:hypothetical protein [Pirellula sp.]
MIDVNLWPMALNYAVWLYNHMPRPNNLSPIELLSRIKNPRNKLRNAHVFGCPVYVLDPKLQVQGGMVPKFTPRSRRGIFVGFSTRHSSIVPLVLNIQTLTITPQFHVVFDDWFTSVSNTTVSDLSDPIWEELFSGCRYQATARIS